MDDWYEPLYNRILDITALFHLPLKLFTILIVIFKTSNDQRNYSYFILNILVWNFLANLLFTFAHLYPAYPAECFRLDGPVRLVIDSEDFGHLMFILIFVCIYNVALALLFAFPYRYLIFSHPNTASRLKTRWVFLFCGCLHVVVGLIFVATYRLWVVSYAEYPRRAELPDKRFLFCFCPFGVCKTLFIAVLFLIIIVTCGFGLTFTAMLLRNLRRKEGIVHQRTLNIQKKLLFNLIILTCIPGLLGGVPLIVSVVLVWFPHLPYSQPVTLVCIVLIANHGTIYAIASLVMFKSYRQAVKAMFCKMINKKMYSTRTVSLFKKVTQNHVSHTSAS